LEASEEALSRMQDLGQTVLDALVGLGTSGDTTNLAVARTTIQTSLDTFASFANTSVNGEYLFAGIDTDVKPFEDVAKEGSAARTAFTAELNAFLADPPPIAREDMTETDMNNFLDQKETAFDDDTAT